MKVGSLFSGIGGLDLGLERAGHEVRWQVEIDPWCRRVLEKHWPDVPKFGDVKEVTGNELEAVDLICGGFPCQTVSLAGRRKGQADDRWLWPEFARIVRVLRPRVVLVENVPGLLAPVGVRDGDGNVVGWRPAPIEGVLGDLAALGFDAEWECLPATSVGAPHLRYRVFVVAYANGEGRQQITRGAHGDEGAHEGRTAQETDVAAGNGEGDRSGVVADAARVRREPPSEQAVAVGTGREAPAATGERGAVVAHSEIFAERPGLCTCKQAGKRGRRPCDACVTREQWATEPDVGRVAHGIPARVDRLTGLGNAVVPQLAEWIGRRIAEVCE